MHDSSSRHSHVFWTPLQASGMLLPPFRVRARAPVNLGKSGHDFHACSHIFHILRRGNGNESHSQKRPPLFFDKPSTRRMGNDSSGFTVVGNGCGLFRRRATSATATSAEHRQFLVCQEPYHCRQHRDSELDSNKCCFVHHQWQRGDGNQSNREPHVHHDLHSQCSQFGGRQRHRPNNGPRSSWHFHFHEQHSEC